MPGLVDSNSSNEDNRKQTQVPQVSRLAVVVVVTVTVTVPVVHGVMLRVWYGLPVPTSALVGFVAPRAATGKGTMRLLPQLHRARITITPRRPGSGSGSTRPMMEGEETLHLQDPQDPYFQRNWAESRSGLEAGPAKRGAANGGRCRGGLAGEDKPSDEIGMRHDIA